MIDTTLVAELLPSALIIKNFVQGEAECNYEKYLLEFVNESPYFRTLAMGEQYVAPESEKDSECDCISTQYQMDFKLIASKTALQARSILAPGIISFADGACAMVESKVEKGSIAATRIHAALRGYGFEELCELRKNIPRKQGVENDVGEILKTLETEKNLLLFFPYKFSFKKTIGFEAGVVKIQEALNDDFQYTLQYRRHVAKGFDTYMAFIYQEHFVFMKDTNACFTVIDNVALDKSVVFQRLSDYY